MDVDKGQGYEKTRTKRHEFIIIYEARILTRGWGYNVTRTWWHEKFLSWMRHSLVMDNYNKTKKIHTHTHNTQVQTHTQLSIYPQSYALPTCVVPIFLIVPVLAKRLKRLYTFFSLLLLSYKANEVIFWGKLRHKRWGRDEEKSPSRKLGDDIILDPVKANHSNNCAWGKK